MAETKEFLIQDVLSCYTGRLMGDMSGVYEVLAWMANEPIYTHQLGRVCDEAAPVILRMVPGLEQTKEEAAQVTPENYKEWLELWTDRYGPLIALPRLNEDEHESIDPEAELVQYVHPSKIITIKV